MRNQASPVSGLTRKLGPLPVWAWAAAILVAYYAFNRLKASNATAPSDGTGAYVPGFDSVNGSAYNTPPGSSITNNYYGDQNAGQASGGGTSSGGHTQGSGGSSTGAGSFNGWNPQGGTGGAGTIIWPTFGSTTPVSGTQHGL